MSKRPLDLDNLRRLVGVVDRIIDVLPAINPDSMESFAEYRRAATAALDVLASTEGARWRETGYDVSLSLGGIRSSATGGHGAALRNWRHAAIRRIGGAA